MSIWIQIVFEMSLQSRIIGEYLAARAPVSALEEFVLRVPNWRNIVTVV